MMVEATRLTNCPE